MTCAKCAADAWSTYVPPPEESEEEEVEAVSLEELEELANDDNN